MIQLCLKKAKLLVLSNKAPVGHQDAISFEVYDTGVGIPKSKFGLLFKEFGKIDHPDGSVVREGMGIGLFMVKQFLDRMGGTVIVKSKEGLYTRFAITVPIRQQFVRLVIPHQ